MSQHYNASSYPNNPCLSLQTSFPSTGSCDSNQNYMNYNSESNYGTSNVNTNISYQNQPYGSQPQQNAYSNNGLTASASGPAFEDREQQFILGALKVFEEMQLSHPSVKNEGCKSFFSSPGPARPKSISPGAIHTQPFHHVRSCTYTDGLISRLDGPSAEDPTATSSHLRADSMGQDNLYKLYIARQKDPTPRLPDDLGASSSTLSSLRSYRHNPYKLNPVQLEREPSEDFSQGETFIQANPPPPPPPPPPRSPQQPQGVRPLHTRAMSVIETDIYRRVSTTFGVNRPHLHTRTNSTISVTSTTSNATSNALLNTSLTAPVGGSDSWRSSVGVVRLQQSIMRRMPDLYREFVLHNHPSNKSSAGQWGAVVSSVFQLRCFRYTPEDYQRYPSLACHITPTDLRCARPEAPLQSILRTDAHIGQMLWAQYLRWDYLLPTCLQIIGDCIQDRSTTYGVPPFLSCRSPCPTSDVGVDPETVLQRFIFVPKVRKQYNTPGHQHHRSSSSSSLISLPSQYGFDSCFHSRESSALPVLEDLPNSFEEGGASPMNADVDLSKAKLKLYQLVKEICAVHVAQNPLLGAVSQTQMRTVIQSVLAHIFTHDASHGPPQRVIEEREPLSPPAEEPEEAAAEIKREGYRKKVKARSGLKRRPPLIQSPHGSYREFSAYGYTCEVLLDALLNDNVSERMVLRVEHLQNAFTWWEKHFTASSRAAIEMSM